MFDVELGDVGELGSCSGRQFRFFARYPPFLLYAAAAALFAYLLFGHNNVANANAIGGASLTCFIFARTLRGSLQFLWRERGRLTFARVSAFTALLAPVGLKGQGAIHTILADIVLLPLCVAVSAFHSVGAFAHLGFIIYPHHATRLWVFGVIPVCGLILTAFRCDVLLPMERTNMLNFADKRAFFIRIIAVLSTWICIPTLSVASTVLPCDGDNMKFAVGEACLSPFHRWCLGIGYLLILLHSLQQDVAIGSLTECGDSTHDERRCDGFMLQLMMFHRFAYVLIAVYADRPIWYVVAAAFSALLLVKISSTPFASARVLDDLTRVSLVLCLLSSSCCSLTAVVRVSSAAWVWLCVWLLGGFLLLSAFLSRYGPHLFESGSDVWVFDV